MDHAKRIEAVENLLKADNLIGDIIQSVREMGYGMATITFIKAEGIKLTGLANDLEKELTEKEKTIISGAVDNLIKLTTADVIIKRLYSDPPMPSSQPE